MRKQPLTFCLTFTGRRSCSVWLLVSGTPPTREKRQHSLLMLFQTTEQIAPRRAFGPSSAFLGFRRRFFQFRLAQNLAIALPGLFGRFPMQGQRLRVKFQQESMHRFGSRRAAFDQTLQFAQDVSQTIFGHFQFWLRQIENLPLADDFVRFIGRSRLPANRTALQQMNLLAGSAKMGWRQHLANLTDNFDDSTIFD